MTLELKEKLALKWALKAPRGPSPLEVYPVRVCCCVHVVY